MSFWGNSKTCRLVIETGIMSVAVGSLDRSVAQKKAVPLSSLYKKETNTTIYEDLKTINPGYKLKYGSTKNCGNCSIAMEMRRRGYDVKARRNDIGLWEDEIGIYFQGAKFKENSITRGKNETRSEFAKRSFEQLSKNISKYGDGARGYVGVTFLPGKVSKLLDPLHTGSGHAMFWEVSNGETRFYDAQSNTVDPYKVFSAAEPSMHRYARLDNLKVTSSVTSIVENRKPKHKGDKL